MKTDNKVSARLIVIWLDTRDVMKNGNYPFRVRITIKKARYYFKTHLEATEELYQRAMHADRKNTEEKKLYNQITAVQTFAENVFDSLPVFTPEAFRRAFYKEATAQPTDDVFTAFQSYVEQLKNENRIGTAKSYEGAALSFAAFVNGKLKEHKDSKATGKKKEVSKYPSLPFSAITTDWLERYQTAMDAVGSSRSTIGIYCRSLRTVYNIAMSKDSTLRELYPFGKGKFQTPTATKHKRALSKTEIDSIRNYAPKTEAETLAKNVWLLSYLLNGANVADLVNLKHEQITTTDTGILVTFIREKTKRKAEQTTIKARIHASNVTLFQSIISQHSGGAKSGYVFPILTGKDTAQDRWNAKTQLIRRVNLSLRKIGETLGIEKDLTTYTARHSFATILLRNNVPIGFISQSLGHSDLKTTENYLGEFDEEKAIEYAANL